MKNITNKIGDFIMNFEFSNKTSFKDLKYPVLVSVETEEFFKKNKCKCGEKCNCSLKQAEKQYDFKGKRGQVCFTHDSTQSKTVVYVGLGKEKEFDMTVAQEIGATILDKLKSNKVKSADLILNGKFCCEKSISFTSKVGKYKVSKVISNMAFGIALKSYSFNKYYTGKKLEKKVCCVKNVNLLCKDIKSAKKVYDQLDLIKQNVFFCRDLVSEPPNVLNPESYADICRELMSLGVEVEVMGEKEMKKLGMNSLLGVGQGSEFESQLVIMKWNGSKNKKTKPIAFVGKGITFDSGGISLKPSGYIEDMKIDMSGSAVVVSLMRLLAMRKAKVNAIGVVALVENMPSGKAQRPGDVVKSLSGQTIEVLNTDAEGRLILADSLYYTATKFKPKAMIDLATLTGAVMIALGEGNAGLFTRNDALFKEINKASDETGEWVWRMPLSKVGGYYDRLIDSEIADMRNIGINKYAGSVIAAQFLSRFTNKHTKWAHLDIAATAYIGKARFLAGKGATGFGVRLLNRVVEDFYEDK